MATLDQNNYRGICTYLDGACNTLNGKDHSKLYMENLAYRRKDTDYNIDPVYWAETVNGNNTQHSWDGDYLVLGAAMGYPIAYYNDISVEMVVKISADIAYNASLWDLGNTTTVKDGISFILIGKEPNLTYYWDQDSVVTSGGHSISSPVLSTDVPHHLTFIHRLGEYVRLYVDGVKVAEDTTYPPQFTAADRYSLGYPGSKEQGTNNQSFYKYLLGIGSNSVATKNNSSIVQSANYKGLSIALVRAYNYPLTQTELDKNFQECKERFGI